MKFFTMNKSEENQINDGVLYFSQRIDEMLKHSTLHIYKAPLLNTFLLAREYLITAKNVSFKVINESHLQYVYEEFLESSSKKVAVVLKKIIGYKNIECVKILAGKILATHECIFLKDLKINGNDIKRLGFSGENIGRILNYLLDIVHALPEKNLYDTLVCEVNELKKNF